MHEVSKEKKNLILINKADFLSEKQRKLWADYFDSINLSIAFFSALQENQNNSLMNLQINEEDETEEDEEEEVEDEDEGEEEAEEEEEVELVSEFSDDENDVEGEITGAAEKHESEDSKVEVAASKCKVSFADASADVAEGSTSTGTKEAGPSTSKCQVRNSTHLLSRDELIELFKTFHQGAKVQQDRTVVGLVGYPNVGKSSTLNTLLTYKKVSVSATPGKTKHFQVS